MTGLEKVKLLMETYCKDLIQKYGFKIIYSNDSGMDSANITLERDDQEVCFLRDRGQTFISFQSKLTQGKSAKIISIDLIKRLLLGEEVYNNVIDDDKDRFFEGNPGKRQAAYDKEAEMQGNYFKENMEEILLLFSSFLKNRVKSVF